MPIKLRENPYKGVNLHLQSLLQTSGTQYSPSIWPGFHANHISHIADFLNDQLPSNYVAHPEQSLQIRAEDYGSPTETMTRRAPDITIHEQERRTNAESGTLVAEPETRIVTLEETIDVTEDFVTAVVIREISEDTRFGTVVARIELLSPSNMPDHIGYEAYRDNRAEALYSEIPLIEVDYLHEFLDFDFGAVYHHTFARGRWGTIVDYEQLPLRFESYSLMDQERIRAKMTARGETQLP